MGLTWVDRASSPPQQEAADAVHEAAAERRAEDVRAEAVGGDPHRVLEVRGVLARLVSGAIARVGGPGPGDLHGVR